MSCLSFAKVVRIVLVEALFLASFICKFPAFSEHFSTASIEEAQSGMKAELSTLKKL